MFLRSEGMDSFSQVLIALKELEEDAPKSVRLKISAVMDVLNDSSEKSIKVNKIISKLEELTDDVNLQSDTRTQIFNIVSLLEVV